MHPRKSIILIVSLCAIITIVTQSVVSAQSPSSGRPMYPPIHWVDLGPIQPLAVSPPFNPATIRAVYQLPTTGGSGTIAIIDAYDDPSIMHDYYTFCTTFGLPTATSSNFELHKMSSNITTDNTGSWEGEEALDVEWAHAIAPEAKILFVECTSNDNNDLLAGVTYAANRSDVVAISMSWGGEEIASNTTLDSYFISPYGATFFASSGDDGTEVQWPAVSVNVVGVGGTQLSITSTTTEIAWSGSGGGLSKYEKEPSYQTSYGVHSTQGFRAVPDVSYNASPNSSVLAYNTFMYTGWGGGSGTSAGSPQWAAIRALGGSNINHTYLYSQATSPTTYAKDFRDITSGYNGPGGFYETATTGYDYITGLGSPLGGGLLPSVAVEDWMFYSEDLQNTPMPIHLPKITTHPEGIKKDE